MQVSRDVGVDWIEAMVGDGGSSLPECGWDLVPPAMAELREYKPDWDGCDANAPDPLALSEMTRFLGVLQDRGFPAPFALYPVACGAVFAEWCFGYEPGKQDYVRVCSDISGKRPGLAETIVTYGPGRESVYGYVNF